MDKINIAIYMRNVNFLGNMVTVMSPEGKPIQVNANALNAAGAQSAVGMIFFKLKYRNQFQTRIADKKGYRIAP